MSKVESMTAPHLEYLQTWTGPIRAIQLDTSEPSSYSFQGVTHSSVSVEAVITGEHHDLTVRFHMHLPQDRAEGLPAKLILEPAEIDDELDQGTIPVENLSPTYHSCYEDRFTVNACLAQLIIERDTRIGINPERNAMLNRM